MQGKYGQGIDLLHCKIHRRDKQKRQKTVEGEGTMKSHGEWVEKIPRKKRDGDCWKEQSKDGILKREEPELCTGTKMEFLVKRNRQAYY